MSAGSLSGASADAASAARPDASGADAPGADASGTDASASDASAPRPDAGPESSSRGERRRRMQSLAGVTVHGSDGKTVGRVRDVYLQDATGELAAITVTPRQLSARSVLLPAVAIAALPQEPPEGQEAQATGTVQATGRLHSDPERGEDHVLHLRVDARTAKAGARPPLTLHATPDALEAAVAALHLEEGSARA